MKNLSIIISLLLFSTPLFAAQPDMRPGLWKQSYTISSQSGQVEAAMAQMQEQLAQMPPEQRKMVEDMMASQGVSFGPGGGSTTECVTAEDIASGDWLKGEEGCEHQVQEQGRKTLRITFNCTDENGPAYSGEGELTLHSPTRYTGKSVIAMVIDDRPDTMTMEHTGEWLAADCGEFASDY